MAKATKKPIQIPFDHKGNMQSHADGDNLWVCICGKPKHKSSQEGCFWCGSKEDIGPYLNYRDNYEFTATLTYAGYDKGRSKFNVIFTDEGGHKYSMFHKLYDELMRNVGMNAGPRSVKGTWSFVKQGANFSIVRVGD